MAAINPSDLQKMYVTEVGRRQAWSFINFCDNRSKDSEEYRLYIDTDFVVEPEIQLSNLDSELDSISKLLRLNGLTVQRSTVSSSAKLVIVFEDEQILTVSGSPNSETTQDVWWISSQ